MIAFFTDLAAVVWRHLRTLFLALSIVLLVVAGTALFFAYQTTRPEFCDTCHYMDPYVRHWQASNHADVACVACHDYGVGRLTISAIKYVTGTYSSRPKANVHDHSCLNSDCHEAELLGGKLEYRRGIKFDHTVHLEQPLRGEKLRCTSCHNQIVQYDEEVAQGHMTVNDRSCFICHFKDAGMGEAITGCDACHGMPKQEVMHAGFVFDHEPYLKMDVECKQCHTRIVRGDGSVPESKCHSCHVERSPGEVGREQLHAIHITAEGIDCFKCHTDIEHANFEMVGALDITCENCHLKFHNSQKQLYMGIGGKGAPDMPSQMFTAQVSCLGCHTHVTPEGDIMDKRAKTQAARASCVTCHEQDYDLMFDNWLEGSKKILGQYRSFLQTVKADFKTMGGSKKARTRVRRALTTAEQNFKFVVDGHISHNVWYAMILLNSSADSIQAAMLEAKKSYAAPDRAGFSVGDNCRTLCHGKTLFPEFVQHEGGELPHEMHITEFDLGCKSCHSVTEHGRTEIQLLVCEECH